MVDFYVTARWRTVSSGEMPLAAQLTMPRRGCLIARLRPLNMNIKMQRA
jgi:hypothetical protein